MWAASKSGGGRVIIFGGADEEGDPRGAEFLSVSQLKLTAWSPTHHERPTQETAATPVRACVHACVCLCVCGSLHEDSPCAGVSLERQISRADIPGQPGGGQSFI